MAEYSANAVQIVQPGESVIFTESPSPCNRGFIRHRDGSGNFTLSGWLPNSCSNCRCRYLNSCKRNRSANYSINFGANISIPTGGTAGPISLAIAIDGSTIPSSQMTVTPAAVDEYFNVSREIMLDVWCGCCETIVVKNISDQPIQVSNANIIISRPDLLISK